MKESEFGRGDDIPEKGRTGSGISLPPLDLTPILGTWQNADDGESGGILRLVVHEKNGAPWVRSLGAGPLEAHDWGEVEATAYAPNVSSPAAWAFTAIYDFDFLETTIVAYVKLGVLVTTTYNTFRDHSGRASYWTREFFHLE